MFVIGCVSCNKFSHFSGSQTKKDRTDVGVGWLVGPPQKKKEPTPFFFENIKALEYSAAEEPRQGNRRATGEPSGVVRSIGLAADASVPGFVARTGVSVELVVVPAVIRARVAAASSLAAALLAIK